MRHPYPALALAAALAPAVAIAQQPDAPGSDTPQVVARLFDCRAVEDDEARLACFDREVDAVIEAQAKKDLVIADREQVKQTRRGLFGFTLPRIGLFGGDDEEDEVKEIIATIARAREMRNGRYVFELEDGARWMQSDNFTILRTPKAGDSLAIKRAALGSYMAKINGGRAFRVKRVD